LTHPSGHFTAHYISALGSTAASNFYTRYRLTKPCKRTPELPHWSLRRPIAAALYLVLFGLIRQLSLLREEFRQPKLILHSELRRRAASRRALPSPSSVFHVFWVSGFGERLGVAMQLRIRFDSLQYKLQQRIICTFADVLTADTS